MNKRYKKRNNLIYKMSREDNLSLKAIGKTFNISRQRVHQILESMGATRMKRHVLERRKQQVYDYILQFQLSHYGVPPRARGILNGCSKVSSLQTLYNYINELIDEGCLIRCEDSPHMVSITGGIWTPPLEKHRRVLNE